MVILCRSEEGYSLGAFSNSIAGMNMANRENSNPPIVPIANENQNTSLCPLITKGMRPATVERMIISSAGFQHDRVEPSDDCSNFKFFESNIFIFLKFQFDRPFAIVGNRVDVFHT